MAVLARRYAKALLEASLEKDQVGQVAQSMARLAEVLKTDEFRAFLFNPRQDGAAKLRVLGRVCGELIGLFGRFLQVVVARRREEALPEICTLFHKLQLGTRGAMEGEVETAKPFDPQELAVLQEAFAKALGLKEVHLKVKENPDLLGGLRVRLAGRLYDSSALGRLEQLRRRLLAAPLG